MLDSLRKFASTWLGKVLGGFLLIGLAGFGISGILTSVGSTTVARVGGQDISVRDFQRAYNNQINNVSSRTGTVPTSEQALAMGIPSAVINQLSSDAALSQLGEKFGLGVSDARLGKLLRDDPNFGDVLGQFDRQSFQRALQYNGFTEAEYLNNLRKVSQRQQIVASTLTDVAVPQVAVDMVNHYTSDERTIEYFTLTSDYILPPEQPTDDELAAYLTENQADFRTVPTRIADVTVLNPAIIAETIDVSDDDIAAEYERTKASYTQVEKRHIRQIVLSAESLVDLFNQGKADGKSFDELVTESGLPVTDLGTLAQAEVSDTKLAEAAFALGEGDFTIIPAALGSRAVSVSEIVPHRQSTLDEVHDQIADKLRQSRARDQYVEILDQIEELRAAFRPIDEISDRYKLPLKEVSITADGSGLAEISDIPEEGRARVASAIFSAELGDLAPSIPLSSNLNVWFDLKTVEPARDQTLDEVRDDVTAKIMAERTQNALNDEVDSVLADLKSGTSLTNLAVTRNLFPELSQPFDRSGDGAAISAEVADAVFNGPVGHFGAARNANGDYVVFDVKSVQPSDTAANDADAARPLLQNALRDNLYAEFVAGLRNDAGVSISQNTLNQVLALDGSGN